MPGHPIPQLNQILDDLEALDWTHDLENRSTQLISERAGVSLEDAALLIERLQAEGKIESVSESGGRPAADRPLDSYGWKWRVAR
jgi:hypothetical protein